MAWTICHVQVSATSMRECRTSGEQSRRQRHVRCPFICIKTCTRAGERLEKILRTPYNHKRGETLKLPRYTHPPFKEWRPDIPNTYLVHHQYGSDTCKLTLNVNYLHINHIISRPEMLRETSLPSGPPYLYRRIVWST